MLISTIICFLCIGFTATQTSFGQTFDIDDAKKYLLRYGYMRQYSPKFGSITHDGAFTEAIQEFQEFANLEVTGVLDDETIRIMNMPRCGNEDKENQRPVQHSRFRRYNLVGARWTNLKLTYRITKYSSRLGKLETDWVIKRAFEKWAEVTPLSFAQITDGKANIEIRFESGAHGECWAFDGRGRVLGHALFPFNGGAYIHFDDDEKWTVQKSLNQYYMKSKDTSLFVTAIHEIGHALGLGHSTIEDAIMYYTNQYSYFHADDNVSLHQDDIDGIQKLYGKKEIDSGVGDSTTEEITTTQEFTTTEEITTTETPIHPNVKWYFD